MRIFFFWSWGRLALFTRRLNFKNFEKFCKKNQYLRALCLGPISDIWNYIHQICKFCQIWIQKPLFPTRPDYQLSATISALRSQEISLRLFPCVCLCGVCLCVFLWVAYIENCKFQRTNICIFLTRTPGPFFTGRLNFKNFEKFC